MTFGDYSNIIIDIKRVEVSSVSYYNHWLLILQNHLLPFFSDMELDQIKYTDIARYFTGKKHMHKSSLRNQYNTLNSILNYAYYDRYIDRNPCGRYKLTVGVETEEKEIYTEKQIRMILDFCYKHKDGLGVFIMLKTGINRAELLGITWSDINLYDRTISINKNIIEQQGVYEGERVIAAPTKNRHRNRMIAIDKETALFIALQRKNATDVPEYLIHNVYGNKQAPANWSKRHYNVFMKDMHEHYMQQGISIPMLPSHNLRHSRASLWYNQGKPLAAIAAQLGWSDYEMISKVYGHTDINMLRTLLDM